jgi:Pyridoxamine 5'-phosphate oxidase
MATIFENLNERHIAFITSQPLFFVATAGREGHVNCSPKGMDTLRVIDATRIVWLSLSGSGNETAAHVLETTRMTLMFCAFEGDALILRVYGTARALHPGEQGFDEALRLFDPMAGSRQIYNLAITRVQTSCGTGVPVMRHESQRGLTELLPFYEHMGPKGVEAYWTRKNRLSIDGKPTGTAKKCDKTE